MKKALDFEDWGKVTSNTIRFGFFFVCLFFNDWKAEKSCTKEQIKNTEVKMNEEEIGQQSEKNIQNNDSTDDQKPLEQNGEHIRIN